MKKVLVVSHERSGTHFLINTLGINFELDSRWIDIHCKDYIDPEDSYKANYKKEIEEFFNAQYGVPTNRIYKAHHQFGYYENIFDEILEHFDIFYIYRDGRDTLSSCYTYFNEAPVTAFPKCDTIDEFLFETPPYLYPYDGAYSYIKSENMVERWVNHIETWKPVFDKINVVSYSNLKNDFDVTVNRLGAAMGKEPITNPQSPPVNMNSINPGRGINGGWKNTMSDETADKIMEIVKR